MLFRWNFHNRKWIVMRVRTSISLYLHTVVRKLLVLRA